MGVMGVAMMPLALRAAICCICTAATVATGDKYADCATRACCWTNCERARWGERENERINNEQKINQQKGVLMKFSISTFLSFT